MLNTNVTSLRGEMQASAQHSAMRAQLDNLKSDIASVKGILLNKWVLPKIIPLEIANFHTEDRTLSQSILELDGAKK